MTADAIPSADTEILWAPSEQSLSDCRMGRYAQWLNDTHPELGSDYHRLWQWSTEDLSGFWRSIWEYFDVLGEGDTAQVLDDPSMPGTQWFPRTRLNYAENMLRGRDDQIVVTAVSQTRDTTTVTRGELRDRVARAAAGLRRLGVGPGDRVAAYLPNIPEAVTAMLAAASIGAIWAVCAPELGTDSVLDRLRQLEPTVLITIDGYRYGAKSIDRRPEVAAIRDGLPSVTTTVGVNYLGSDPIGDISWDDLLAEPALPRYDRQAFNHPLWVLFSSGTTGLPKAIVHSHGGIVLELQKALGLHSDLGPDDTYFVYCTTTWVMWNIQVSGLLLGAAIVLFDGDPNYPGAEELWRIIEDAGVTVFGAGAAFLIACRKRGVRPRDQFDLSRLRAMVSTGSPLPSEGFRWVYEAVNPTLYLQSTSGGTDVCTSFVGGSPLLPVRAGEITTAALGVLARAFDAGGQPVTNELGELVISAPMPSMPIQFWNDPGDAKYRGAYFDVYPGHWRHGDWVTFNDRGACIISGRSDGTLNRGGIRLGTSEFYSALQEFSAIEDSLVVHLDDPSGGLGSLLLFVCLHDGAQLDDELRCQIAVGLRRRLSPRHVPDDIIAVPAIPYNMTGKKLEVPVKRILLGAARQTVVSDGAVRNPRSLDVFEQLSDQLRRATH